MKNRYLIYFCLAGLFLGCFSGAFVSNVNATTVYSVGLESGTVGDTHYNESIAYFYKSGSGSTEIDDSPVRTGSRSWKWQALTNYDFYVELDDECNKISFWYYMPVAINPSILFYNNDDEMVCKVTDKGSYWANVDHEDAEMSLGTFSLSAWNFFSIQINSTDDVYFSCKRSTGTWSNNSDTPRYIRDNFNFSYIKFDGGSSSNYIHFDDFNFYPDAVVGGSTIAGIDSLTVTPTSINLGGFRYFDIDIEGEEGTEFFLVLLDSTTEYRAWWQSEIGSSGHWVKNDEPMWFSYAEPTGTWQWYLWDLATPDNVLIELNMEVVNPLSDWFYEEYYNDTIGLFAEFNINGRLPKEHRDIEFVYFLPENNSCNNKFDCGFKYRISLYVDGEEREYIDVYGENDTIHKVGDLGTWEGGERHTLYVYNITDGLTDYTANNYLYESTSIVAEHDTGWNDDGDDSSIYDNPDQVIPKLDQPLASIVGFIIVVFSLLTPFILAGSISKKTGGNIQVPTFVYAITGGMGIAVSVILEMFPSWVIFFLIAVGIIAIVMMYLIGNKKGDVV